jgi:hypothetical protein
MERTLAIVFLLALPAAPAAGQSLSYRILLNTDGQLLAEDEAAAGPLADDQLASDAIGSAQALVHVDYGDIALQGGSEAQGSVAPGVAYQSNPLATFEDEITIEPPSPELLFTNGSFESRLVLTGNGGATAGGAEQSNTRARYSLFARITSCLVGCEFHRTGEWFDFGSEGGGGGFSGDPVGTIETGPHEFAFGIAFPVVVSLSIETQATADTEVALAETFGDVGASWRITEVRSGDDVVAAAAIGASGVHYVPEPDAALLGPIALAGLALAAHLPRA